MRLVVDASVAIKWFLREREAEQNVPEALAVAQAILEQGAMLSAPPHWTVEVMAVVARLSPGMVPEALTLLDEMRPNLIEDAAAMRRGVEMAVALNHHLFDTLYHAVALEAGATLVTADDRYFDKAAGHGGLMRLADFPVAAA